MACTTAVGPAPRFKASAHGTGPARSDWTAQIAAQVAHRDLNQLTDPAELAARTTARPLAIAAPPNRPYQPEARSIHR